MKIGLLAFAYSVLLVMSTGKALGDEITAFIDVNVVPMSSQQVLRKQTVIVRDGLIESIGATSTANIPAQAQRIEGHGKAFLLPGLVDMHTHIQEIDDLPVYLTNGVTTVLDMGLAPTRVVAYAERLIASGIAVGPDVYFAAMIDGDPPIHGFGVKSVEDARAAVRLAKGNGYRFIKLYNNIKAEQFAAICEEAKLQGLPVIGHGVRAVGLPRALFEGQVMVAHAEEFYYAAFDYKTDSDRIAEVVAETRRSGAFVTPNLSAFETIGKQWGRPEVVQGFLSDARTKHMSPTMRLLWRNMDYVQRKGSVEEVVPFLRELTKAMQDAGVPLLTGTDSPVIPGMYPGYSIHDDIASLIRAGLTPYAALAAATRTPGEFMAKYLPDTRPSGTIAPGMQADLILVEHNPLEQIETLKAPLGVMSNGKWRDAATLNGIAAHQAEKYDSLMK